MNDTHLNEQNTKQTLYSIYSIKNMAENYSIILNVWFGKLSVKVWSASRTSALIFLWKNPRRTPNSNDYIFVISHKIVCKSVPHQPHWKRKKFWCTTIPSFCCTHIGDILSFTSPPKFLIHCAIEPTKMNHKIFPIFFPFW